MKINTKSWHYRWVAYVESEIFSQVDMPKSLCGYFWNFLFMNGVVAIFQAVITLVIFLAFSPVLAGYLYYIGNDNKGAMILRNLGFTIIWVEIAVLILMLFSYLYNKDGIIKVFVNFLLAKKAKVCPIVEYVE